MIEEVRGTTIGVGRVVESSAESREYMLTYFWGMGSIYLLGGWVEILGG